MKIIKVSDEPFGPGMERRVAVGLVTSTRYLRGVAPFLDPRALEQPAVRHVAKMCLDYFSKYRRAPGRAIEGLFDEWKSTARPGDAALVEELLRGLAREYSRSAKFNAAYLLDQTAAHLNAASMRRIGEEVERLLHAGRVEEAEARMASYKRVSMGETSGGAIFANPDEVREAFERDQDTLFALPGRLGLMANEHLCRDCFVALMGPEKRGKTWWLIELATRAAKARCNVAFFGVGDMSRPQVLLRLGIRIAGRSNRPKYCDGIHAPVLDCLDGQRGRCRRGRNGNALDVKRPKPHELLDAYLAAPDREPCARCARKDGFRASAWYKKLTLQPLKWREAWKMGRRFVDISMRGREFRLSCAPTKSVSVRNIRRTLDVWEAQDGFVPDVVVVDYADILAPEDSRIEFRHQQDAIWAALRALSLERHCLVLTATQSAGRSYLKPSIGLEDYSEDKRKYAHVTAMFALNQTPAEKRACLMRMGALLFREGTVEMDGEEVVVAQSVKQGRPLVFCL